jgi:hypothetical protein
VVWLVELVLGSTLDTAGGVTTTGGGCTTTLGVSGTYVVSVLTSRLAHPAASATVRMTVAGQAKGITDFICILLL